jgi:hypothetical protein
MKLEDQIRALLEAKNEDKDDQAQAQPADAEAQGQADRVEDEPAVKIENPMDPNLTSSEGSENPQDEIAAAEQQGVQDEADEDKKEKVEEAAVAESISDLLGDEFSDEFKLKAQTIFEAAVKDQVTQIQAKLQEEQNAAVAKLTEEFEDKFIARSKQLEEETSDKIDGYLNFLAEEWKQDNKIALEHAIKSELTESFITNLKSLFEQHYVDLPEDKVDVYVKALEEKTELENALATTVGSLTKLTEEVNAFKREQIITEAVKDFTSLDAARFKTLTEDFAFEDSESFKTKLGIVKQSFFNQKQTAAKEQLTEELTKTPEIVEDGSHVETVTENTVMDRYVRALGKK